MKMRKQGQINSDKSTLLISHFLFTDIENNNYRTWHAHAKFTYTYI